MIELGSGRNFFNDKKQCNGDELYLHKLRDLGPNEKVYKVTTFRDKSLYVTDEDLQIALYLNRFDDTRLVAYIGEDNNEEFIENKIICGKGYFSGDSYTFQYVKLYNDSKTMRRIIEVAERVQMKRESPEAVKRVSALKGKLAMIRSKTEIDVASHSVIAVDASENIILQSADAVYNGVWKIDNPVEVKCSLVYECKLSNLKSAENGKLNLQSKFVNETTFINMDIVVEKKCLFAGCEFYGCNIKVEEDAYFKGGDFSGCHITAGRERVVLDSSYCIGSRNSISIID